MGISDSLGDMISFSKAILLCRFQVMYLVDYKPVRTETCQQVVPGTSVCLSLLGLSHLVCETGVVIGIADYFVLVTPLF